MDDGERDRIFEKWQELVRDEAYDQAFTFTMNGMRIAKEQNDQETLNVYARFFRGTTVLVESNFDVLEIEQKDSKEPQELVCSFCVAGEKVKLLTGGYAVICSNCSSSIQK